jgi:prepilin-type N-terminal cleavage/methylation domain-containing protein/prepilin-type processing-associated H-X9-DG protein
MKRGFTLIELLVVIAIIAILAAILFPVFAQAKTSAKAASSLSNDKQINLAALMYAGDYDDMMVRMGSWNSGDPDCMTNGSYRYAPWTLALDPYQKNVDLNSSPLGPNTFRASSTFSKRRQGTQYVTYGYNYTYLSPSYTPTWPTPLTSISATSVASPAATIMIGERMHPASHNYLTYWYAPTQAQQDAGMTWMIAGNIETPYCYNDPDVWCTDGWGYDTFWNSSSFAANKLEEGSTIGLNATKNSGSVTMSFVDGHAKRLKPGAIAAGTNWNPSIQDSQIVVTDASKYLWDTKQ